MNFVLTFIYSHFGFSVVSRNLFEPHHVIQRGTSLQRINIICPYIWKWKCVPRENENLLSTNSLALIIELFQFTKKKKKFHDFVISLKVCDICNSYKTNKDNMTRHKRSCKGEKIVECRICHAGHMANSTIIGKKCGVGHQDSPFFDHIRQFDVRKNTT